MNLPAFLTLGLVLLAGNGLLRLFGFRCTTGPERLGFSFAAGATLLAAAAALLSLFAFASAVPLMLILVLAAVAPVFLQRPVAADLRQEWISFLPALAVVALSFWLAAHRPVWNVDAHLRWVMHGQWLAAESSLIPDAVADAGWAPTHPTYPPLVPSMVGLALQLGASPDVGVRVLFPGFLLALLGLLHGFGTRALGIHRGWMLPLAFGLTPALTWLPSHGKAFGLGADAAVADVPLALMLTALSILLLDAFRRAERAPFLTLSLMAAGAVWTKQEGAVYALALLALTLPCAAWIVRGEARRRAVFGLSLVFGAALAAWLAWKAMTWSLPVAAGEDYLGREGLAALVRNTNRLPAILSRLGQEFADFAAWGPLWLFALAAAVIAALRRDGVALLPAMWLALGLAVAAAGFLASGWREGDFALLMDVSLTRLLLHHAPLVALMVAELGRRNLPREAAAAAAKTA